MITVELQAKIAYINTELLESIVLSMKIFMANVLVVLKQINNTPTDKP